MAWAHYMAAADRAVVKHLGESSEMTYEPGTGAAGASVSGIFDDAYQRVEAGEPGVSSTGPAAFFLLADLPTDPSEDDPVIVHSGTRYTVTEAQPDGKGGVILHLHVEAPGV